MAFISLIVHYIGNEALSVSHAHGNTRQQAKLFFRTKPSVFKNIESKVELKAPHKVYKELITQSTTSHEAVSKPRNVKQIQNRKAKVDNEQRLSHDAIFNTHDIAYEEPNYIWHITTYPDLVIVAGQKDLLNELDTLTRIKDEHMLLSYDTTFCLGEFYVSPLLFKHIMFESLPVIPALFLISERKLQEVHESLFKIFMSHIKRTADVPIVVDMEAGIVNAIQKETNMALMGCWRHMKESIDHWLSTHVGDISIRKKHRNDVLEIFRCLSEEDSRRLIHEMENTWEPDFTRYFSKNILPKLRYFCLWAIAPKYRTNETFGITTNQSEGFNFLLHDFQEWKEAPIDTLILALKMLQSYYLHEIARGKSGIGNYVLRDIYSDESLDVHAIPLTNIPDPSMIVRSIRERNLIIKAEKKEDEFPISDSKMLRASAIVKNDRK